MYYRLREGSFKETGVWIGYIAAYTWGNKWGNLVQQQEFTKHLSPEVNYFIFAPLKNVSL
jgi:hypothetical protein